MRTYLESQIRTLKSERDSLNDLLEKKTDELFRTRSEFAAESKKLNNEIQSLRN